MVRLNHKYLFVGVVAVAALGFTASQAEATWWGCCSPVSYSYASCYTPCYTSCCYTSCCDPCGGWYLGYRPGPVRRLLFGPYRWYYAGGCGWNICCDPCYTSCCDTVVSACDQAMPVEGGAMQPTPAPAPGSVEAAKPAPAPAPGPDAPPPVQMPEPPTDTLLPTTMTPSAANSGLLTIWVPAKAKVFINGVETKSIGSRRRYVSYGLEPGLTYKYEVRAELVRDGRIAEETQTVYLMAGDSEGVAFGFNRQPVNNVAMGQ
ncbi:MAG: TIGR03000 domain-containing protein [Pirellulales bacterium]|nr:TIGR03000 domain-containing protein [Pirellulales bacterium]